MNIQRRKNNNSSLKQNAANGLGGTKFGTSSLSHPAYATQVSLYRIPPDENVSMDEFECFSYDRLKVLQELSAIRSCGLKDDEKENRIYNVVKKYLSLQTPEDIRKDVISHFTLRLAFCKSDSRSWFVQQECELLSYRLRNEGSISSFLQTNGLHYSPLSEDEYQTCRSSLQVLHPKLFNPGANAVLRNHIADVSATSFFKVPFEKAIEMVRSRKILLIRGDAIIHRLHLIPIVISHFREELNKALAIAARSLPSITGGGGEGRIGSLLEKIHNGYNSIGASSNDFKLDPNRPAVSPETIDVLSNRSFPLCMKVLHRKLRDTHHLKHGGRLQYGLFLKGIGLKLDDAMTFWRAELGRVKNFDTNYAYNVKHNYGAAGPRSISYNPYSCAKIIEGSKAIGDTHLGCPFAGYAKPQLYELLRKTEGLSEPLVADMMKDVQANQYQVACKKYFDNKHVNTKEQDLVIKHPNSYTDKSMKHWAELVSSGSTAPVPASSSSSS